VTCEFKSHFCGLFDDNVFLCQLFLLVFKVSSQLSVTLVPVSMNVFTMMYAG